MTKVGKRAAWPLLAGLLVLWLTLGLLYAFSLRACDGNQVYALDDAYIHLELARQLAEDGTWGLKPGSFAGASSSLLWPLLLVPGFHVASSPHLTPLLLNTLLASVLLALFDIGLRDAAAPALRRFLALLALIYLAPLPSLVFSGMEHLLQALLGLLLLLIAIEDLRRERGDSRYAFRGVVLALCAFLLAATRYEGLFLTLPLALAFFLRRRPRRALLIAIAAILPALAYGIVSRLAGGLWLPNSIMAKGKGLDLSGAAAWIDSLLTPLLQHISRPWSPYILHVLILIPSLLLLPLLWRAGRRTGEKKGDETSDESLARGRLASPLLAVALLGQLLFAGVGWFFRYESWLIVLVLFVFLAWLPGADWRPFQGGASKQLGRLLALLILMGLGTSLVVRGAVALSRVVPATRNVYEQPIQAAFLLERYYPGRAAIVGDLGAAAYFGSGERWDLMGLCDADLARVRRSGRLGAAEVEALAAAKNAPVALLHERVFGGVVPASWVKTGEWILQRNVVLGDGKLAFYATSRASAEPLREHLIEYSEHLPAGVETRFYP